jgi:hypothetical protein
MAGVTPAGTARDSVSRRLPIRALAAAATPHLGKEHLRLGYSARISSALTRGISALRRQPLRRRPGSNRR